MASWEYFLSEFARRFAERRAREEGFTLEEHSFYVYDLETQFLAVLFTGYVKNFYYMSGQEVLELSLPLHTAVSLKDPEFYVSSLRAARELPAMKDQVMIGAINLSKSPARVNPEVQVSLVSLLASFPPNQIVKKYVNAKRRYRQVLGGLGSFEKKVLREVWNTWPPDLRAYYAAKYRRYVRDMVRTAHIPVEKEIWDYVKKPLSYEGPNEYLAKVSRFLRTKSTDLSFDHPKLPFNLVRSNLPKSEWTAWILENADLTGNTVVLQAKSLYSVFGDDFLPYLDRAVRSPTVTSDRILKAMLACLDVEPLAYKLAEVYAEKVKRTYRRLLLPLATPTISIVLDASGSMRPENLRGEFGKALSVVAPFAPLVRQLVLFSDKAGVEDHNLLGTWRGITKLVRIASTKYNSSTCITCGLKLALEAVKSGEIDTVVIATDEQANVTVGETKEMDLIREILDAGAGVIVVNPTPYPVHVADVREERLVYVPAPNPESFAAALRLLQIRRVSEEKGAKELVKVLVKWSGEF